MPKNVLVDTCIWIEFFRGDDLVSGKVQGLVENGVAYTAGMVLYELFQGVRSERERLLLKDVFKGIPYIDMNTDTWMNAAALSKRIRSKGVTLPPSDILIGQIAIENNLMVLSLDEHFKKIPDVQLIKI